MNNILSDLVYPVVGYALDLKEQLEGGAARDIDLEQRELLNRLQNDAEARRLPDFIGEGAFLGARYALVCWLDELFIVHSPWSDLWNEKKLEVQLFNTLDRAWKFWAQADMVLGRPGTPKVPRSPGLDAVEVYYLAIVLGFRGKYLDEPAKVQQYVDEMRVLVARPGSWQSPRDLGITTYVPPLQGREVLQRAILVYGCLTAFLLLVDLLLMRFLA